MSSLRKARFRASTERNPGKRCPTHSLPHRRSPVGRLKPAWLSSLQRSVARQPKFQSPDADSPICFQVCNGKFNCQVPGLSFAFFLSHFLWAAGPVSDRAEMVASPSPPVSCRGIVALPASQKGPAACKSGVPEWRLLSSHHDSPARQNPPSHGVSWRWSVCRILFSPAVWRSSRPGTKEMGVHIPSLLILPNALPPALA